MKSKFLFLPIIAMTASLCSCSRDYKFNTPDAVIRNRTNDNVSLVYGYESNADLGAQTHIKDFNNVILKNLKNAKFEGGTRSVSEDNKFIEFSLGSYSSSNGSIGVANFKLYDNGYITYTYPYTSRRTPVIESFAFTFDAALADKIIKEVYEEFDIAKVEEERFIKAVTLDTFFQTMQKGETSFKIRDEDRINSKKYYDNGNVLEELKKLEYTPFTEESERIDRGQWDFEYTGYLSSASNPYNYESGKVTTWSLLVGSGVTNKWAYMSFYGQDCYDKHYSLHAAYKLDEEQMLTFVDNVSSNASTYREIKD